MCARGYHKMQVPGEEGRVKGDGCAELASKQQFRV